MAIPTTILTLGLTLGLPPGDTPGLPAATLAETDLLSYAPLLLMLLAAITFGVGNVIATMLIGPKRDGATKGTSYESGMNPVGTARKRFNVRFYLIAMVFLVFDVEVVFLYPWASVFSNLEPGGASAAEFLARVLFFLLTTVVAYVYGYMKGVFTFD